MIYTVAWTSTAEAKLADLWTNAPVPADVTNATDRIEQTLRHDPLTKVNHEHEGLAVGDSV
jgi:hypothetical protein